MDGFLAAFFISFGVIFVAELGDKSQLMALTFATRYKALPVLIGITIATSVVHLVSVAVGYGLGAAIPTGWISLVAAVAFLGFGAWTLRGDSLSDDEEAKAQKAGGSAVVAASVAFFLAELGDKTMLATITLATQHGWFGVWLGSTVGMVVADALAIVVGRHLGRRLPERVIAVGAATLFVVFGLWLGVEAIGQLGGPDAWATMAALLNHHLTGWIALVLGLAAVGVTLLVRRRTHAIRHRSTPDAPRTPGSPAWWARVLFVLAAVLGFAAPVLVALDVLQPIALLSAPSVAVVGAGVLLLGFAVVALAQLQLGSLWRRNAAALDEDPESTRPVLATGGLYRWVRHPGLTGLIVGCAGMLAMSPTLIGVLATVLILVAVQVQARAVSEPSLGRALGDEYDAYLQRTGRFLPRVRPPEPPPAGMPSHHRDRARVG
ncbi:putative Ca2+/H+ antiporter (TMEM165/GDT1 family) [Pseudonocardia sediminis]|uniref:Putative Ca2+/H+ antiporter (TMEM165/GDT1 family) n=1 Tax=Pseudonocardia sediminis TaxID=1397368 RepID=A0A4Q7UW64_PSEST|nr:TMEM165/GDT1 family protein [Pseudonocardia sediminis]RZT84393.1 putative Ca2+/H+ antiporter (TMEM165/GDT1 family) [Pseudonocardia sediminis]